MIYTSYYRGLQRGERASISLYPPKKWDGSHLRLFAPSPELFNQKSPPECYIPVFKQEMVAKDNLIDLWLSRQGDKDITLNCYEKPGDFCHRHLVGEIIKSKRPDFWGGELSDIEPEMISAISVQQPWAYFIGRYKFIETRSWGTPYLGPLAIHGSKPQKDIKYWLHEFRDLLPENYELDFGAVVAIANLTACIKMTPEFIASLSPIERRLGFYEVNRYAWVLEDVQFIEPIPARGHLGLWKWKKEHPGNIQNPKLDFEKRYTWTDAPNWWNPTGEMISEIKGDCVILDYGGRLIPINELIEVPSNAS